MKPDMPVRRERGKGQGKEAQRVDLSYILDSGRHDEESEDESHHAA